jgi:hypothetical protein
VRVVEPVGRVNQLARVELEELAKERALGRAAFDVADVDPHDDQRRLDSQDERRRRLPHLDEEGPRLLLERPEAPIEAQEVRFDVLLGAHGRERVISLASSGYSLRKEARESPKGNPEGRALTC